MHKHTKLSREYDSGLSYFHTSCRNDTARLCRLCFNSSFLEDVILVGAPFLCQFFFLIYFGSALCSYLMVILQREQKLDWDSKICKREHSSWHWWENDTLPVHNCLFYIVTSTCWTPSCCQLNVILLALRIFFSDYLLLLFFCVGQNKVEEMTWNLLDMYLCTSYGEGWFIFWILIVCHLRYTINESDVTLFSFQPSLARSESRNKEAKVWEDQWEKSCNINWGTW